VRLELRPLVKKNVPETGDNMLFPTWCLWQQVVVQVVTLRVGRAVVGPRRHLQQAESRMRGVLDAFFFVVLGLELGAYTLSHSTSPIFVMVFFNVGSCKLFAWAGFEQRSS
jgi:hypothetical protein